ncbi:hypothetical protein JCM19992_00690 [Thermostilla marina]
MFSFFVLAEALQEQAADAAQAAQQTVEAAGGLPITVGLTIFVLAVFVGFEIITKIPPTLHTPLMSGSNAISGITLVGALLAGGSGHSFLATTLGFLAIVMATINVVGGFLVTDRMLHMFKRK